MGDKVQNHYFRTDASTTYTSIAYNLPTSQKALLFETECNVSGDLRMRLLTHDNTNLATPFVPVRDTSLTYILRAIRSHTVDIKYEFTQAGSSPQQADISVSIKALDADDMVTLHGSDGGLLTSTDGRLDTTPYGSTGLPLRADASGKLVVVLDGDSIAVDVVISDITPLGSEGTSLYTDASGMQLVILVDPSHNNISADGAIKVNSGTTTQQNYLDVSQGVVMVATSVKLQTLSAVNMRSDLALYLKLYDQATAPVPATHTPVATYALFPQRREHLSWVHGLNFTSGVSALCTQNFTDIDTSYCLTNDCMIHLSYV